MTSQTHSGNTANAAKTSERRLLQLLARARRKVDKPSYKEARQARELLLAVIGEFQEYTQRAEAEAIIGESYFVDECWAEALVWLKKSESVPKTKVMRLIGDTLCRLDRYKEAASYYRQLLSMYEQYRLDQPLAERLSAVLNAREEERRAYRRQLSATAAK